MWSPPGHWEVQSKGLSPQLHSWQEFVANGNTFPRKPFPWLSQRYVAVGVKRKLSYFYLLGFPESIILTGKLATASVIIWEQLWHLAVFLQEEQLLLQRKVVLASIAVVCTRTIKTCVSVLNIFFQQLFVYNQFSSGLYHLLKIHSYSQALLASFLPCLLSKLMVQ